MNSYNADLSEPCILIWWMGSCNDDKHWQAGAMFLIESIDFVHEVVTICHVICMIIIKNENRTR